MNGLFRAIVITTDKSETVLVDLSRLHYLRHIPSPDRLGEGAYFSGESHTLLGQVSNSILLLSLQSIHVDSSIPQGIRWGQHAKMVGAQQKRGASDIIFFLVVRRRTATRGSTMTLPTLNSKAEILFFQV